jgi:hypothetical protein
MRFGLMHDRDQAVAGLRAEGYVQRLTRVVGEHLIAQLRPPDPAHLSHAPTDALSRASTEELLLELRRRITRPRNRRRDTWDDWDRLDSRGDWPEEA